MLSAEANQLKLGRYRHFKGNEYRVLGVAFDSESLEEVVVYQQLYGSRYLFVRPLNMFMETVECDGKVMPRFEYIGGHEFVPKPGQVDFTHLRFRPAISCIVKHGERILLVKRSSKMNIYPGLWNAIGGYLDDEQTLEEKVREELKEEVGIEEKDIISIQRGGVREFEETKYQKTWLIHPVLVEVKTDRVILDWEADEYQWVTPEEVRQRKNIVPSFINTLNTFFRNQ